MASTKTSQTPLYRKSERLRRTVYQDRSASAADVARYYRRAAKVAAEVKKAAPGDISWRLIKVDFDKAPRLSGASKSEIDRKRLELASALGSVVGAASRARPARDVSRSVSHSNIDKSGFRRGQYVGYGGGLVFRIKREGSGWRATEQGKGTPSFYGKTLGEISKQLRALPSMARDPRRKARRIERVWR